MNEKKNPIDETTLHNLLYLSRLSPESTNVEILSNQVRQIVDYFEVLEKYAGDENPCDTNPTTTAEELRVGSFEKTLEASDLKKLSTEYMDGYFRVPKVLGGGA